MLTVVSDDLIQQAMLPGLRCLRQDMEQLMPTHEVSWLIKVYTNFLIRIQRFHSNKRFRYLFVSKVTQGAYFVKITLCQKDLKSLCIRKTYKNRFASERLRKITLHQKDLKPLCIRKTEKSLCIRRLKKITLLQKDLLKSLCIRKTLKNRFASERLKITLHQKNRKTIKCVIM